MLLTLTGSFQIVPAPATQVITLDMVAATRWLRANAPKDAARAITVEAPAGPLSYWQEIGLLGQSRDKAAAARRDFTVAPPAHAGWLIAQQLAPVAIAPAADMPLPGESILARFGDVAIMRRAARLDPTPLNPLLICYRSFWSESVVEQRHIQLPPDLAPGIYQVAVCVHDFAAGHALEVPGSADGLARIGEIVIE